MPLKSKADRLYEARQHWAAMEAWSQGVFSSTGADGVLGRYMLWYDTTNDMEAWYRKLLTTMVDDVGTQLAKPRFNLLQALARVKAVSFKEDVRFYLLDPENDHAPIEDTTDGFDPARLDDILWDYGVRDAFQRMDEMSVYNYGATFQCKLSADGTRVIPLALPYYCTEVCENPDDPSDTMRARSVTIPKTGDAYPDDYATDELYYAYETWGGQHYASLKVGSGQTLSYSLDEHTTVPVYPPEVLGNDAAPGQSPWLLRVQTPPYVFWRERKIASPYAPLSRGLLNAQVEIATILAYVDMAFKLGAHGMIVLSEIEQQVGDWAQSDPLNKSEDGDEPDQPRKLKFPGSVQRAFDLPKGRAANLLQPRMDPYSYVKYVEALIRRVFVEEGMNANTIIFSSQGLPSNYSGTAKMIDAQPTEQERQQRETLLARQAVESLNVWRKWHNSVAPEEDRIPERLKWAVNFQNAWNPNIVADQAAMQSIEIADRLGLVDRSRLYGSINGLMRGAGGRQLFRNVGRRAEAERRLSNATDPSPDE